MRMSRQISGSFSAHKNIKRKKKLLNLSNMPCIRKQGAPLLFFLICKGLVPHFCEGGHNFDHPPSYFNRSFAGMAKMYFDVSAAPDGRSYASMPTLSTKNNPNLFFKKKRFGLYQYG